MEKEKKLDSRCIVSLGFRLCSRGRQRTGNRASLRTDPTQGWAWRRCHAVLTACSPSIFLPISRAIRRIFCAGRIGFVHEELQPGNARSAAYHRCSAPRRVGPYQHRSLSADSVCTQDRCLGMDAQAGQTAPALGEKTASTTQDQISGNGIWMWPDIVCLVNLDQYLSHSGHGSFSSLTPHPILAAPFVEVPSPNPIGSPTRGSLTPSVSSSWFRPLSTSDQGAPNRGSPLWQNISLHQSDTHPSQRCAHIIRARSILAQSSAAATEGCRMTGERMRSCLDTGRATKRQRTRSRLSLGMCPKCGWTRWRGKTVFVSVFIARNNFRALPVRRPRAQSTALAVKSTVQNGLASDARVCKIRMCNLTLPRNRHLTVVQCVRTSWLRRARWALLAFKRLEPW